MRHTSYGDLPGAFAGKGIVLFWRGLPIWLLFVGPILVAFFALGTLIDWDALSTAMTQGDEATLTFIEGSLQFRHAIAIAGLCVAVAALAAVLLYPLFQAIVLRWWISGLRFGTVVVTSRLKTAAVYWVYLRFILYILLLMLGAMVVGAICLFIVSILVGPSHDSTVAELLATAITIGLYVVVALGASTVHQVVVTLSIWRLGLETAELGGVEVLNAVHASGRPSSALGEGLADALGVGGM
jgi:flagellar biosynthesis protein FliQ